MPRPHSSCSASPTPSENRRESGMLRGGGSGHGEGTTMSGKDEGKGPGPRRPTGRGQGTGADGPKPRPAKKRGGLGLKRIGGPDFELVHPRCVAEMELDYEEGMELWREGDVEAARDALRFALQGCGDNLWVHVALGRIALQEFNDL